MSGSSPKVLYNEAILHEKVKTKKIAIVYASWHSEIIDKLLQSAISTLKKAGFKEDHILKHEVPGSFEIPLGVQMLMEFGDVEGVIALGCLIKGETPHFHYISESVTKQLAQLALRYTRPVGYGVLTVESMEQAEDRAGGKWGNKGQEAAEAVLAMLSLKETLREAKTKNKIGFGSID